MALDALRRRLGVNAGAGWKGWLWRLFVPPPLAPPAGRLQHAVDRFWQRCSDLLARELGVPDRQRPGAWLLRLFVPPPRPPATAGRTAAWRRWLAALLARLPQVDAAHWGARIERAAATPWLHRRPVVAAVVVACAFSFWLVMTTPLAWTGQLLLALGLWGLALWVRKLPGTVPGLALMMLALLATGRYGWWRVTQSMDLQPGWEMLLGWGLLAAEAYAWLVMVLGFVQTAWPLQRRPVALPPAPERWPTVDVFIPTYNEPLAVLVPTVLAAKGLDWPADKLRITLLDDGRRDEIRAFAAEVGVGYGTRPDNLHAKAGNLNHALARSDGEFVAIFDCDHLPSRSFLQLTMGELLRDERCAMVQTPHHFFSPDPFERNLETFGRVPNEGALFYGLIQDGNDFWNATFFCGSCAVLRREALMEVGGIAVETVTEDAHTALKLHRRGWRTAYLNITQAAGLATESLSGHVGQRIRWARGMAQIFRLDNPLLGPGLSFMQRICYSNAMLHFFYGIPRMVFLTAPLAYLFGELHIIRAEAAVIALYALPHMVLPNIANAHLQGPHRHTFWAEVYEAVLAWYITLPTTLAFINPRAGKFNVTAKGGLVEHTHFDWSISRPYLGLVVLNAAGLGMGIGRLFWWNTFETGTVLMNLAWTLFNLLVLGAALGVARERRQVRLAHRVPARLPVCLLLPGGHTHRCETEDYSLAGLGLKLAGPLDLAPDASLNVLLFAGSQEHVFPARVSARRGDRLGLRFGELDWAQQQALIQCTFARADAWTRWNDQYGSDHPLQGLREIVKLGAGGYASLGRAWTAVARKAIAGWRARTAALLANADN
ncbi:MAG: UDP-forming cellulose synthase catalytic subunit [Leptothrix sp. (in: Bacteria)]|nr:UDP-forming cellulose synthase catalytic subunit [Leptothrix sp. (in: b-proteobacteria)]